MGGSLFPADNSGIAGIMFGLVGLVLFGVTITLVMDGQLMTGAKGPDSDAALADNDATIAGLETQIKLLAKKRTQREDWHTGLTGLKRARTELAALEEMIGLLTEEVARERVRSGEIDASFAKYRTDHRNRLWANAVGQRMDDLRLPGGKIYQGVTIRSISAEEFKISHAAGSATIAIQNLPRDIVNTYLLSPGEARRITEARREREREQEQQAAAKRPKERTSSPPRRPPSRPRTKPSPRGKDDEKAEEERAKKQAEIAALRAEAAKLRSQISVLAGKISEATMQAAYGKRRSPPGSLETWSQRLSRLATQDGKIKAHLSGVESQLRQLDPTYRPPIR